MWLIPLVWGWFAVGTHHSRRQQVAEKLYKSTRDLKFPNNEKADPAENAPIKIREPESYLDNDNLIGRKTRQNYLGFSIGGDELADGPFYNYARSRTWSNLSSRIVDVYTECNRISRPRPSNVPSTRDPPERPGFARNHLGAEGTNSLPSNGSQKPIEDSRFTAILEDAAVYESEMSVRFSSKNVGERPIWARKAQAFGMAFVLHGIFGWSAFMIDYMTPTIGIGCRAFICMTYTLVSLFSCFFLILASEFSDSWSFQFERYHERMEELLHERNPRSSFAKPSHLVAAGAVSFRLLGKTLAILNSVFIVAGCILEFVGLYESCFCKSSHLGLGKKAYVSFLSTDESLQIARPFWYGGAGAAISAVLIVCFGYFRRLPRAK